MSLQFFCSKCNKENCKLTIFATMMVCQECLPELQKEMTKHMNSPNTIDPTATVDVTDEEKLGDKVA